MFRFFTVSWSLFFRLLSFMIYFLARVCNYFRPPFTVRQMKLHSLQTRSRALQETLASPGKLLLINAAFLSFLMSL